MHHKRTVAHGGMGIMRLQRTYYSEEKGSTAWVLVNRSLYFVKSLWSLVL